MTNIGILVDSFQGFTDYPHARGTKPELQPGETARLTIRCELPAFDVRTRKIVKPIPAPGVHGVIAVPQLGRIFASATDAHEVMTINEKTVSVTVAIPPWTPTRLRRHAGRCAVP